LKTLKHILERYSHWVWSILQPLGAWGIFGIAFVDSSFFGIPLDPVVAGYVYEHPQRLWLYVLVASAGSAIGSLVPYAIGRGGGELLLLRRIDRARFERMRDRFANQEFFGMMVPAMLPPPTPFKLFVISAGVFEMRVYLFLLSIFAGRVIRFATLALLVAKFGPNIVNIVTVVMARHLVWVFAGFILLIALVIYEFKFRRPRRRRSAELS